MDLSKSTFNDWTQFKGKKVSRNRVQWVNTVEREHQLGSLLGILSPLSCLVSTALEAVWMSYTIWASWSSILPSNRSRCRPSFGRGGKANESPGTRPTTSPWRDPIKHCSGNRWPCSPNPTHWMQQAFIEPLEYIRRSERCWGCCQRNKMTLFSRKPSFRRRKRQTLGPDRLDERNDGRRMDVTGRASRSR